MREIKKEGKMIKIKQKILISLILGIIILGNAGIFVSASTATQNVSVNILPLFLTVHFPVQNGVYDSLMININASTLAKVARIEYIRWLFEKQSWLALCTDCDKYGYFNKKNRVFDEGKNEIGIRAIGYDGKVVNEKKISFFIDSKKPWIKATEPKKFNRINQGRFSIKYNEENLKDITLFYGGKSITKGNTECSSGNDKECVFIVNISEFDRQWIIYWFVVSDSINIAKSEKTKIFVDTISPLLNINAPEEILYKIRKVPFNLTVSKKVTISYLDFYEKVPNWKTLCKNCEEYGFSEKRTKTFNSGLHDLLIIAADSAGNYDIKEVKFSVDFSGLDFF